MGVLKYVPVIFLALLAIIAAPLNAQEYEKSVLTVDGHGEITVKPDVAYLNIAVETNSQSAGDAVSENTSRINSVVSRLKEMTGQDDTLRTTRYNLQPIYEYDEKKKKSFITSYRVTSEIRLKTYLLDKLGQFIDVTTDLGANRISGPAFENSQKDENKRKALAKAVEDAMQTAKTVANAAGVRLGSMLRINPSYSYPGPVYKQNYRTAMADESSGAPVIESGDITVDANVTLVYEILQD